MPVKVYGNCAVQNSSHGTSQVVKSLRFHASRARSLVEELRSQMPQGAAEKNKIVATAHM